MLVGCAPSEESGLFNDLAAQLDEAGELTFTAEYRLAGGASALLAQAQEPKRAVYQFPGGKLVTTDEATTDCRTATDATRCTLTAPPTNPTDPVLELVAGAERSPNPGPIPSASGGLVAPSAALRLVSQAALDGGTVTRHETTIAGKAATCVGVHGSAGLTVCITKEGVLGRFTGTVNGNAVQLELERYSDSADPSLFATPAGATVEDKRPR
ncbi:hypothetical protein Val02_16970 [Virgisporangium aliadipatigenens]|uniref:Uncharacterized protein n=1 Tax=Virgisporangium aliadipatigenens TaxID=741659 RepID=A0A8J3YJ08_9ACTN|nr:hypothetical protein [Virgisporangium aliadipatigenens]GIJ44811.1 hypothetical protein Val02_16970 [Virgisporangium aliadipatigenens]